MAYSAKVLRNRGVPVEVYKVREVDGRWEPVVGADGETPETETRYIRFDFNVIADIEEAYGGTAEWQAAINPGGGEDGEAPTTAQASKVASAIRKTFALTWGEQERKVGACLVVGDVLEYGLAIGLAWGMANGLDPTDAAKRLTEAMAQAKTLRKGMGKDAETDESTDPPTGT